MSVQVLLDDLEYALMRSADSQIGGCGLVCRKSGAVYYQSNDDEFSDPDLPEDIDDPDAFAAMPDQRDLGLGQRLVFRFISERAPRHLDTVHGYFSRRGAYGRFKGLLEREGLLDAWHDYENAAQREALIEWATGEGFEVVEECPKPAPAGSDSAP